MKVLFTHDHKFYKDERGLYYSDGQYPYRLWRRYLEVFDEIVVAARVRPLALGEERRYLDLSSGPRVRFVEIPSLSNPLSLLGGRKEAVKRLTEALNECDGLIARISEISRIASGIAEKLAKPWLAEVVYCPFDALWNHGTWQGKLYAPYAFWATRQMVAKAPYALYVTKEFLQRRYPCAGKTASCSDVQLMEQREEILKKRLLRLTDSRKKVRIGLIGTLANRIKGIHTALEALGRLKNRSDEFEFHILGGGDSKPWKQLAEKNGVAKQTFFCGTLPQGTAVNQWLDQVDIYIQPSFQEGLPRALLEAMGRACPAIASTAGGIPELIERDYLHKPGDSIQLARLIEQALGDKVWQEKQARRNFLVASAYRPAALDSIRRQFWLEFSQAAQAMGGYECPQKSGEWQNV